MENNIGKFFKRLEIVYYINLFGIDFKFKSLRGCIIDFSVI